MGVEDLRFVITGAATGIGEATAQVAANKGASVVVADITDEAGESVAAGIRENVHVELEASIEEKGT